MVYLDQWVWIQLSRAHYGASEEWTKAHDAVILCAANGTARFPLSFSHVVETAKRPADASRGRLVDFMMEIWHADAIRPWTQMLGPEARNAVNFMTGKPPLDLTDYVFGKGIPHLLGMKLKLVPRHANAVPPTPDVLRRIGAAVFSPDLLSSLKDPSLAGQIRGAIHAEEDTIALIQDSIGASKTHPDKKKRRDIAEARFMVHVVGDHLIKAMMLATDNPKGLVDRWISSRARVAAIRERMPTSHTYFLLNYRQNGSRQIKKNDLWDLALNIAIPYCDIVATETKWCNLARSSGLDRLWGTKLIHRPAELAGVLGA